MTGHIVLISCLLAICLPIIFVQLPRFDIIKNLLAENRAETRSALLRRRPLSPPWKTLRWSIRPWSEADTTRASAETEQEKDNLEQLRQKASGQRRRDGSIFQGDACADSGALSREAGGLRRQRAGNKPWDPPFQRDFPTTGSIERTREEQCRADGNVLPPRKIGRHLKAKGVATRLFSPGPVPEIDYLDQDDQSSTASSPPLQNLLPKPLSARSLWHSKNAQHQNPLKEHQPKVPQDESQRPDLKSPSSLVDGSSPPRPGHSPYTDSASRSMEPSGCHHKLCCSAHQDVPPSQSQNSPRAASKEFNETFRGDHLIGSAPKEAIEDVHAHGHKDIQKAHMKAYRYSISQWQALLVLLTVIIFIFAFAILVAHCLAWFLVYKTEARLGEVRKGLLMGGEMKLCLCGKG